MTFLSQDYLFHIQSVSLSNYNNLYYLIGNNEKKLVQL